VVGAVPVRVAAISKAPAWLAAQRVIWGRLSASAQHDLVNTSDTTLDLHPRVGLAPSETLKPAGAGQLEQLVEATQEFVINDGLRHRHDRAVPAREVRHGSRFVEDAEPGQVLLQEQVQPDTLHHWRAWLRVAAEAGNAAAALGLIVEAGLDRAGSSNAVLRHLAEGGGAGEAFPSSTRTASKVWLALSMSMD
jgi:hypothetical protein